MVKEPSLLRLERLVLPSVKMAPNTGKRHGVMKSASSTTTTTTTITTSRSAPNRLRLYNPNRRIHVNTRPEEIAEANKITTQKKLRCLARYTVASDGPQCNSSGMKKPVGPGIEPSCEEVPLIKQGQPSFPGGPSGMEIGSNAVYVNAFSFNHDGSCFIAATTEGFRVFTCSPLSEFVRRESHDTKWPFSGVLVAAMLYRSHCFAFVTEGEPQRLYIWDDRRCQTVGDVWCCHPILHVLLGREVVVLVTKSSIYLYAAKTMSPLLIIATSHNPLGLCALAEDLPFNNFTASWRLACPAVSTGAFRLQTPEGLKASPSGSAFVVQAHQSPIGCIALSPAGCVVATASVVGTLVRLFSAVDGLKLQELRLGSIPHSVRSITFRRDGQFVAVSSSSRTIHIFKLVADDVQPSQCKPADVFQKACPLLSAPATSILPQFGAPTDHPSPDPSPLTPLLDVESTPDVRGTFHETSDDLKNKGNDDVCLKLESQSTVSTETLRSSESVLLGFTVKMASVLSLSPLVRRTFSATLYRDDPKGPSNDETERAPTAPLQRQSTLLSLASPVGTNLMSSATTLPGLLTTRTSSFSAFTAAVMSQGRCFLQGTLKSVMPKYFNPERSFAQFILPSDHVGDLDVRRSSERDMEKPEKRGTPDVSGGMLQTVTEAPLGGSRHSFANRTSPTPSADNSGSCQRVHYPQSPTPRLRWTGPLCSFAGSRSNHLYVVHHDGFFYEARFDAQEGGQCQILSLTPWFAPRKDFLIATEGFNGPRRTEPQPFAYYSLKQDASEIRAPEECPGNTKPVTGREAKHQDTQYSPTQFYTYRDQKNASEISALRCEAASLEEEKEEEDEKEGSPDDVGQLWSAGAWEMC